MSTSLSGTNPKHLTNPSPAQDYGDVRGEFQALLSHCGIFDLPSRARVAVTGSDRVRWMNGMTTNNVRDLAVGNGVYAFVLNAQGRIQADLHVFRREESLVIDTDHSQLAKLLELFDRFIISDDVEIRDITDQSAAFGLIGPEALAVIATLGINTTDLNGLQFADSEWRGKEITLLRWDEPVNESWQIWIAPEEADTFRNALIENGGVRAGAVAQNLLRIARGIPKMGVDIRDRDLPQETAQTRALNFTKGCYLGQEIVERIRSRGAVHRQFTSFAVEGDLPEVGAKILADEKEVGEITSSTILPLAGVSRPVALGYLRREAAQKVLLAGTATLKPESQFSVAQ